MDDQEKDGFGVSWGPETFGAANQERLKNTKRYSSFHLKGVTYCVHDTVYLRAQDGPPYIAKIISMFENTNTKEKNMSVRWFCRNCELPDGAAGVDFKPDSKEIFMSWGYGSKNTVITGCTIGKCNVLCTTPLSWNTPSPTTEMIAAADHVFSYAFDTKSLKLTTLQVVINQFGEGYVKGSRARIPKVIKSNGGSPRKAVEPGTKLEARVIDSGKRDQARVAGPSVATGSQKSMAELIAEAKKKRPGVGSSDPISEPGISKKPRVTDSFGPNSEPGVLKQRKGTIHSSTDRTEQQRCISPVGSSDPNSEPGIFKRPRVTGSFGLNSEPGVLEQRMGTNHSPTGLSEQQRNISPVGSSDLYSEPGVFSRPRVTDYVGPNSEPGVLKQRKATNQSSTGLSEQQRNISPVYKGNEAKTVKVEPVELLDTELKGRQMPGPGVTPSLPVPKFFKMPWHKALEIALEKGRALRLQNLDPWFSSSEIEGMLTELFGVSCEARMLPPKDFSSYISGEALVLYRSEAEADDVLAKLTENVLIWSEDQRPVVVSVACKERHERNRCRGFLDLDRYNLRNALSMPKENGGATSTCAQPNTVAFEMGMQWRLLQERHTAAWNLAAQSKMPIFECRSQPEGRKQVIEAKAFQQMSMSFGFIRYAQCLVADIGIVD